MGHEFTMVGVFKLTNNWSFRTKRDMFTLPALIWKEKEFWWERNTSGGWDYKGETDKGDLYQSAPGSPTWGGFAQGKTDVRSHNWVSAPGSDIRTELHTKLFSPSHQSLVNQAKADIALAKQSKTYRQLEAQANIRGRRNESELAQWWYLAEKLGTLNRKLPCAALDRPGMALSGGSGQSGGGFVSKTTSPSRRRVLQFDLGMVGSATRFTATQVLETQDANPTISKYIIPGQTDDWCKNIPEEYLAYWRTKLNTANVEDQTTDLEPESALTTWVPGVIGRKRSNAVIGR